MVEKLNIVVKNATHHLQPGKHCMNIKLKVIHTNAICWHYVRIFVAGVFATEDSISFSLSRNPSLLRISS